MTDPSAVPGNPDPGGLTVTIDDLGVEIVMTGGATHVVPVGPVTIVSTQFEGRDPPAPAGLTNALGTVQDHLDDILIDSPIVATAPSIVFVGHHAMSLARVEFGDDAVAAGHRASRRDIEEVFRTVVAESAEERRANPGLDDDHVGTIVANVLRRARNHATIGTRRGPLRRATTFRSSAAKESN